MTEENRVTKSVADYRKPETSNQVCGNCRFFEKDENHCHQVIGHIEADMVCDLWKQDEVLEGTERSVMNVLRREFPDVELQDVKRQGRVKEITMDTNGREPNVIANRLVNEVPFDQQIQVIDSSTGRASDVFEPNGTAFKIGASKQSGGYTMDKAKRILEGADPRNVLLQESIEILPMRKNRDIAKQYPDADAVVEVDGQPMPFEYGGNAEFVLDVQSGADVSSGSWTFTGIGPASGQNLRVIYHLTASYDRDRELVNTDWEASVELGSNQRDIKAVVDVLTETDSRLIDDMVQDAMRSFNDEPRLKDFQELFRNKLI